MISTHALREEGDRAPSTSRSHNPAISTHALREEGDRSTPSNLARFSNFYPRPPRGGRPLWPLPVGQDRSISTHALREEGDLVGDDPARQ